MINHDRAFFLICLIQIWLYETWSTWMKSPEYYDTIITNIFNILVRCIDKYLF